MDTPEIVERPKAADYRAELESFERWYEKRSPSGSEDAHLADLVPRYLDDAGWTDERIDAWISYAGTQGEELSGLEALLVERKAQNQGPALEVESGESLEVEGIHLASSDAKPPKPQRSSGGTLREG